ncbi:MAG TPA: hypothetical protein VIP06_02815 [Nocardioides sp.]
MTTGGHAGGWTPSAMHKGECEDVILVRFHGYPREGGEHEVGEFWLSQAPATGETLLVDGARLEVKHVEWDLTRVEVTPSGTTVGLAIDVSLCEPSASSWVPKRFESPPAMS